MLTIENAKTYAVNVAGAEISIIEAYETSVDGIATIVINFWPANRAKLETMHVWIEGDRLYGEW